jgi:hypothetical protein
MKHLLFFALLAGSFCNSFSQNLAGEWKGTFTAYLPSTKTVNQYYKNNITIEISLNKDSTYTIYSYAAEPYARGNHNNYKCEIAYLMVDDSNIILEEIGVIEPGDKTVCFKKMNFKIVPGKKRISLEGSWQTNSSDCDNRGEITLSKKL